MPDQYGTASILTIGGSTIIVPVIPGFYPNYVQLIPALPDGNTGSRIAINGTYISKIGALANKYADSGILRMSTSSPSAPMRLDWHGTGWIATAVVMPMYVTWPAPAAPAPAVPAPAAPAPAAPAPASAAPAVCESCIECAIDDNGASQDIAADACITFGADMTDHECDSDESGDPCACTGHSSRE